MTRNFEANTPPDPGGYRAGNQRVTKEDLPHLITARELAEVLGISLNTLYNWRAEGKGPRQVPWVTGKVMYDPADVLEWIEREKARQRGRQHP